jgi:hypothetical protein
MPGKLLDGGSRLLEFLAGPGCPCRCAAAPCGSSAPAPARWASARRSSAAARSWSATCPRCSRRWEANVQLNARSGHLAARWRLKCAAGATPRRRRPAPAGANLLLFADCIYDPGFYDLALRHRGRRRRDHACCGATATATRRTTSSLRRWTRALRRGCCAGPARASWCRPVRQSCCSSPAALEATASSRPTPRKRCRARGSRTSSGDVSVYLSTRSERCPRAQSGESG